MAKEREDKKASNPRKRVVNMRKRAKKIRDKGFNSPLLKDMHKGIDDSAELKAEANSLERDIDEAIGTADKKKVIKRKVKKKK